MRTRFQVPTPTKKIRKQKTVNSGGKGGSEGHADPRDRLRGKLVSFNGGIGRKKGKLKSTSGGMGIDWRRKRTRPVETNGE